MHRNSLPRRRQSLTLCRPAGVVGAPRRLRPRQPVWLSTRGVGLIVLIGIFTAGWTGCAGPDDSADQASETASETAGETTSNTTAPPPAADTDSDTLAPALPPGISLRPREPDAANSAGSEGSTGEGSTGDGSTGGTGGSEAEPPSVADIATDLQLPADLNSLELINFFGRCDAELRRLGGVRITPQSRQPLLREIKRVALLKRTAAERLLDGTVAADRAEQTLAIRARLQALSHLAAAGDLAAGDTLAEYAISLLDHPENDVKRDSRTALLSLSLERLQGGVSTEPDDVLRFAGQLISRPELMDVSSVHAVQRARTVLRQYGYDSAAAQIWNNLQPALAASTDPEVQDLAVELLIAERYAALEGLRQELLAAKPQPVSQWRAAATDVATAQPDMLTLQYLVSIALQLESLDRLEEAAALYEVIDQQLSPAADADIASNSQIAVEAFQNRQTMIGKNLPSLASETITGQPFALSAYKDYIVLMPFWATERPESLLPFEALEQFVAGATKPVLIVGVNMDSTVAGRQQAIRLATEQMPWPSIFALPNSTANPNASSNGAPPPASNPNALPEQLGVVSFPTVVVLDQQGRVVKVALSQEAIEQAVADIVVE
ncbi:TlpA family protein disulfide reductase [Planctomycetaceae bacterium SH139]